MKKGDKKYFIALTGAKKNAGDFLITDRAIALLKHITSEHDFIIYPHWNQFQDIEFVNNSEGIIILGGPGFQMNMFPGVYKLIENIEDIHVPIYTLGVGWYGKPGDETTEKLYHFSNSSKRLLDKINATYAGLSCRDYQTERVLKNNGYENVTMTGCPVWYDLDSIGKEFVYPKRIKKIVYTPAQRHIYSDQSIKVLEFLKNKYSDAEIIVSFHRGVGEVDEYTSEQDAKNTQKIADFAKQIGVQVADVSYSAHKLNFYDNCDIHIGYRVHAHIYFLSKRLPSILLHEDGRGNGVSEALKSPGINAYDSSKVYSKIFKLFKHNYFMAKVYSKIGLKINKNIISDLSNTLDIVENTNYECFENISKSIDEHYRIMEEFIKRMIYGEV